MDRQVIDQKLESLRRCLERIQQKCPATAQELINNIDLQDIIALNLSRAVQISVDIGTHLLAETTTPVPTTMGQTFDLLAQANILDATVAAQLKKAVGFRNIAVHNYEIINWLIVHKIAQQHLINFKDFATQIFQYAYQQAPEN